MIKKLRCSSSSTPLVIAELRWQGTSGFALKRALARRSELEKRVRWICLMFFVVVLGYERHLMA